MALRRRRRDPGCAGRGRRGGLPSPAPVIGVRARRLAGILSFPWYGNADRLASQDGGPAPRPRRRGWLALRDRWTAPVARRVTAVGAVLVAVVPSPSRSSVVDDFSRYSVVTAGGPRRLGGSPSTPSWRAGAQRPPRRLGVDVRRHARQWSRRCSGPSPAAGGRAGPTSREPPARPRRAAGDRSVTAQGHQIALDALRRHRVEAVSPTWLSRPTSLR